MHFHRRFASRLQGAAARLALGSVLWLGLTSCAQQVPLPPKALEMNALGAAALVAGDLETAGARLNVALEYNPDFVDALTNLGLVELQRGNFTRAQQLFERALRQNPNVAQPHHGLGVLAEHGGDFAAASSHYRAALRVDPGFFAARANLGRVLLRAHHVNAAMLEFRKLVEVAPESVEGHRGLAESLLVLGRKAEAAGVLQEAEPRFPDDPGLDLIRARIAIAERDPVTAERYLGALSARRDSYGADALAWLSVLALLQQDNARALTLAERAVQLDPRASLPAYALAVALDSAADVRAERWLRRALELDPGNPELERRLQLAGRSLPRR